MKKTFISAFLLAVMLVLAACGSETGADNSNLSAQSVIDAFESEGLEVGETYEMTKDDYGLAPMKSEEGIRFLIPSMGEDAGGRVLTYEDEADLDEMKEYYDSLGEESAAFFSWTIKHKNVLVQIGGDLPEEDYNEYKSVVEGL